MIGSNSAAPWESEEQRLAADAADFTWMVSRFANETAGVVDAIAVSSDGLLIAVSRPQDPGSSERLAAVVSGMTSPGRRRRRQLRSGRAEQGHHRHGGRLPADHQDRQRRRARRGHHGRRQAANVAYEMTLFANRVGAVLSPALIIELKNTVGMGVPARRPVGGQG